MYKSAFLISFLMIFIILSSCYNDQNTYGEELVGASIRSVFSDSTTIKVSSVLIDSLETSGLEIVLAGQYKHPVWGSVFASGYIAYNRPSYNTDADGIVMMDSIVLYLKRSGYSIGDTTQIQKYNIHLLTEKIILNDNGYLYNKNTVSYDPEPLGSYTYNPKSTGSELMEIRLSDELGQDLLDKLHRRDMAVSSDRFEDYFKGIVIIPDEEVSQSLLAFSVADTSAALSLRYKAADALGTQIEILFTPNTTTQFNHIGYDPTGTIIEPYVNEEEIQSELLENKGFIMGGVGWYAKLEIPYLNNLMQFGEKVTITQATLIIYPEPGTYSDYNSLPENIYLYIADENNVITNAVTDYLGEEVQSGVLIKDDTYDANTYYYFDVTDFMQQELGAFGVNKHNLQLVFGSDDYTKTIKNMTFSNKDGHNPIVLQLTYKIYESY
ncbi:MAG: DUF4270 domain-containing protein [Tannerella sp.]|jgi:hypothetical protein|nr:DUF4270 domain-containing protein [Tannerella sp.]